jgi:hypothetical protein
MGARLSSLPDIDSVYVVARAAIHGSSEARYIVVIGEADGGAWSIVLAASFES